MSNCNLLKEAMDFVDYIKTKQPLSEEQLTKLSSTLENLVNTVDLKQNQMKEALEMIAVVYKLAEGVDNKVFEVTKTLVDLEKTVETLTEERDAARREICLNEAAHLPTMSDPHRTAKQRGWDCFEKLTPNA